MMELESSQMAERFDLHYLKEERDLQQTLWTF